VAPEQNASAAELAHFERLASRWWDPEGEFRTLHALNPVRLALVDGWVGGLADRRIVDIGCGGGLLAEAMALAGARVTGIDLGDEALAVARLHAAETASASGRPLALDYRHSTAEELAAGAPGSFDAVTCMEMLEHVPDPASVVAAGARLLRPGGTLIVATINRTAHAFLRLIVGGEYLTGLIPRGTHRYDAFIAPSELDRFGRAKGLTLTALRGVHYHPLAGNFRVDDDPRGNYVCCFQKAGAA
jgi:2-polyprenyl-6-hydroxyphenyl methylase/3-demethylubiquinone-9 3-methyltransferase